MQLASARAQVTRAADRTAAWVAGRPVWALAGLVAIYVVVVNGVWVVPNIDQYWAISRDLTVDPFHGDANGSWTLTSYLLPALAHALHMAGSIAAFAAVAGGVLAAGYVAVVFAVRRRFGDDAARALLLAFACLPVGNDMVTFIGTSDGLVWTLTGLLVACRPPAVRFALAALLAVAHREQAAVVLAALTLTLPLIEDDRPFVPAAAALWAGFAAGAAALAVHFCEYGIVPAATRLDYARSLGLLHLAVNPLRQPTMTAVSLFAVYWPAVILMLVGLWQADRRAAGRVLLALGGALAVTAVTVDQTRVFALLAWPVVMVLIVRAMRRVEDRAILLRLSALLVAVGLVLPRPILWDGEVHSSALLATIGYVSDSIGLTHVLQGAANPRLVPFRARP